MPCSSRRSILPTRQGLLTRGPVMNSITAAATASGSAALPNGLTISPREVEVLELIAKGRSNAQIARDLYVTVGTVKSHVHAIATKLGARDLHLLG